MHTKILQLQSVILILDVNKKKSYEKKCQEQRPSLVTKKIVWTVSYLSIVIVVVFKFV